MSRNYSLAELKELAKMVGGKRVQNLNDEDELKKVLIENNFDVDDFIRRITDQNVKDKLISNTENAVKKGVFGAPTIFVGDQMFFGQDRMEFIEEYLNN